MIRIKPLLILLLLWYVFPQPLQAQEKDSIGLYKRFMNSRLMQSRFVQRFISSEKDSTRSAGFVVVPLLGYAPETGLEYGLSSIYNFYLDKADTSIRTSSLVLQGSFTTKHQTSLKFTTDIWTRQNKVHLITEIRYRDFPFNFYGMGDETWKADK